MDGPLDLDKLSDVAIFHQFYKRLKAKGFPVEDLSEAVYGGHQSCYSFKNHNGGTCFDVDFNGDGSFYRISGHTEKGGWLDEIDLKKYRGDNHD